MSRAYFITGTDTETGKTIATLALMVAIKNRGKHVTGMKPVACGCKQTEAGLRNSDALMLMQTSSSNHDYNLINPYAFESPVAPQFAAAETNTIIDLDIIVTAYKQLARVTDYVFVEGIGGWCVPLDEDVMLSDLVKKLQLPVILVVGLRLGCVNHALLSTRSILDDGVRLKGWIANCLDKKYLNTKQTLTLLESKIPAPFLGYIDFQNDIKITEAARGINTALLL